MLILHKTLQQVNEHLRVSGLQLLFAHLVAIAIVSALGSVVVQIVERGLLTLLGVSPVLQRHTNQLVVGLLVNLDMLEHVMHECDGLLHVLAES